VVLRGHWGFIAKHRDFFTQNPRLGMMVRTLDKMDPEKVKVIQAAADALRERLTLQGSFALRNERLI
jgi:deoxyribodipyrimidine photolyase-like uncharacterized protein